jgi:hypothetical protein
LLSSEGKKEQNPDGKMIQDSKGDTSTETGAEWRWQGGMDIREAGTVRRDTREFAAVETSAVLGAAARLVGFAAGLNWIGDGAESGFSRAAGILKLLLSLKMFSMHNGF